MSIFQKYTEWTFEKLFVTFYLISFASMTHGKKKNIFFDYKLIKKMFTFLQYDTYLQFLNSKSCLE